MTCPDPMSAEEWQAQLECEPAALIAGQAYGTEGGPASTTPASRDPADTDPAGVAAALAAQAAAASARRQGPGQPGSARLLAGESCSRAAAFGTGMPLDVMPACPGLALLAGQAAGPDDSYTGASDDELIGVLCAWDRIESHAHARKLAAIIELRRRRPVPKLPTSGRPAGPADEDYLADEIAHVLGESRRPADGLAAVAGALDGKLPRTRAGLLDGTINPAKARITVTVTAPLDEEEARAVEDKVLGRAGRITPGSLREAVNRAVIEVAPDKARKRRETAARDTRVEQWAEDSGNAALAGRELPPADAIAAGQRITWWARQLRTAGVDGDLDQLRGRAFTDLLLNRDSRPTWPDREPGRTPLLLHSRRPRRATRRLRDLDPADPRPGTPHHHRLPHHRELRPQVREPGARSRSKLRHLARIRHAACTSPICRRPAATCDFEHNIPYEAGGRTCLCNAGPKCRHDHRVKQHPRWKVDQNPDGTFTWTTPSGRRYTTEPTRYPI